MAARSKTSSTGRSAPAQNGDGRRERNKRDKRDRIVAAARELFGRQGYRDTTSQQISEGAGIAAGTLFLYAKSKEDLLILVFENEMCELIERAYASIAADAPIDDQVRALFKRFIAYHARDVAIARELIREITFLSNAERRTDLIAITETIVDKLATFTQHAIDHGELDLRTQPRTFANCLFSIYYQQLQTWLGGYVSRRQFERTLSTMLDQIIDGYRRKRL